jgi:uridine kinase
MRNPSIGNPCCKCAVTVFDSAIGFSLSELAEVVARVIAECRYMVLAVTGPSAGGKSSFVTEIGHRLGRYQRSAEAINVDDYLRIDLRGERTYRIRSARPRPMKPSDLDFHDLAATLSSLRRGDVVIRAGYLRGEGWVEHRQSYPADILILDGLFLDSDIAADTLAYDLLIAVEAPWNVVADRRRHRDSLVRSQRGNEYRGLQETEEVIERTRSAYVSYIRRRAGRCVVVKTDARNRVSSIALE